MPRLLPCLLVLALIAPAAAFAQDKVYEIEPAATEASIHNFLAPNLVIPNIAVRGAPLVVFLTGAGEKPAAARDFLKFLASQGYSVIALEYDDAPGVAQVCAASADPDCAEAVRRMRVEGGGDGPGTSPVGNPPIESITARLILLLRFLTEDKPGEGWDYYLDGDNVRWEHVAISGLAEGGGMAAYIAKHHQVARVVLFSSPEDQSAPGHLAAPWLSLPSATPAERWFARYHARETAAGLIKSGYTALGIPADHIDVASDPSAGDAPNPFSFIRDRRYQAEWASLFAKAAHGEATP